MGKHSRRDNRPNPAKYVPTMYPGVEQEVGVFLADLRAANLQATAAGCVNELPSLLARRVLERRAAGT